MKADIGEWVGFSWIKEEECGFRYVHFKFNGLKKVKDEQAGIFQYARSSLGVFVCTAHCDIVGISDDEDGKLQLEAEDVINENDPKEGRQNASLWVANFYVDVD